MRLKHKFLRDVNGRSVGGSDLPRFTKNGRAQFSTGWRKRKSGDDYQWGIRRAAFSITTTSWRKAICVKRRENWKFNQCDERKALEKSLASDIGQSLGIVARKVQQNRKLIDVPSPDGMLPNKLLLSGFGLVPGTGIEPVRPVKDPGF